MKKLTCILIVSMCICINTIAQKELNTDNWYIFKVYTSGLQSDLNEEMLARTIEKKEMDLFCAFDYHSNEGYIITTDKNKIYQIEDLINSLIQKVTIQSYEEIPYTDELLLNIYSMRGNVMKKDIHKKLPPFINLGPKFEISNKLYTKVKDIWISFYPDSYKQMISEPKPLSQQEIEERNKKTNYKP